MAPPWKGTTDERLAAAKERTKRLVDATVLIYRLRAQNEVVLYSDTLAKQVPQSFGAHAFNTMQRALHEHELVRLCSLWDNLGHDRASIPSVIKIADDPAVLDALSREMCDGLSHLDGDFAQGAAEDVYTMFAEAKQLAEDVLQGPTLQAVSAYRHQVAHTLLDNANRAERLVRYGDEVALFKATVPVVDRLYVAITGASFGWGIAEENATRCAQSFWHGVTLNIQD